MNKKVTLTLVAIAVIIIITLAVFLLHDKTISILQPQGIIATQQRNLLVFATLLASLVVIPVFAFALFVALRYREGNDKAAYTPNWNLNKKLSLTWVLICATVITTLGIVSWRTTHQLDPYKPLDSQVAPITIQVVALQWKWLFIYPEQKIATVNYVLFPEKTPINFVLTADAPMNSFWIPQLGGQMYAMEGMSTKLHLMADTTGDFRGSDAEISGKGFASMAFTAKSTSHTDFDTWVQSMKTQSASLDMSTYDQLAKPSEVAQPIYYASVQPSLYDMIVMKFMPSNEAKSMESMDMTSTGSSMSAMPGM